MKKVAGKKVLILLSLLLFLPLFSGCFLMPINHAPVITSTPITTAKVGELYIYDVEATDPDGDTLRCSLTRCPRCMTIDSKTGVINWIPTSTKNKSNGVIVKVSDGELYDTQSFSITVSEAPSVNLPTFINHAPVITSTPITIVAVDELYTYDVDAADSDGDTLSCSLTVNPTGMTIDSVTGEISWTPNSGQIGDNDVTVEVSDGEEIAAQTFIITVYDILTSITVLPETMSLFVGEDHTITSITAHYNYGSDKVITLADDCSYSWNTRGIASVLDGVVTGVAEGSDTLSVSYEENSVTKTDTVTVTVNPIELTSITVLPETMTLFVGEDVTITSITASYNYGADKTIALADCSYSSDNVTVATVAIGVVTGEAQGSAIITVSYTEGTIIKTDTVAVTVKPIPPNLELFPPAQSARNGESFSINVEVENAIDLLDASIALNFNGNAMQYFSAAPGDLFSSGDVIADSDPPVGSITLWLDSIEEPASGTGTIMIVSFIPVIKGNNYPITFGVTELKDNDNQIIVHTTGSGCKVHIKK